MIPVPLAAVSMTEPFWSPYQIVSCGSKISKYIKKYFSTNQKTISYFRNNFILLSSLRFSFQYYLPGVRDIGTWALMARTRILTQNMGDTIAIWRSIWWLEYINWIFVITIEIYSIGHISCFMWFCYWYIFFKMVVMRCINGAAGSDAAPASWPHVAYVYAYAHTHIQTRG